MDSLTQLTFGAACGEAVLGQKVGRKALVWGAVLGTLPDLDVFIPLGGPVNDFVYHRGFSHSLILLALLSPMIAWLISKIHPDTKRYYRGWVLLSFLVLEASVLLDLLTIYGTQIFWPFDTTPMAIPVLFIIDPLFTLPIFSGVLAALVLKRNRSLGHRLNSVGLFLSLFYLIWAFGAGEFVERRVRKSLPARRYPIPSSYLPRRRSPRCYGGLWASRKTDISKPIFPCSIKTHRCSSISTPETWP
jgi:inner membrane protein